jgi:SAM-dependent methyltransferase
MRPEPLILDLLRCPACGGATALDAQVQAGDGHVMEGELRCLGCAARFPIRGGIPRMMPAALAAGVAETVDAFGWQWQQASRILKDPRFSADEVFLDFIHPVPREWFRDKVVLDAGCGLGRFTAASARFGAKLVVAVDLSASVDLVFESTRHLTNVVVIQADILALPLARGIDYGFSVAVLHHTANPRAAFLHLASKVVPGGSVSAWVYGRENNGWIVYGVNPIRRITSRLPRRVLLFASYALALPLTAIVKGVYGPVSRRPALAPLRRWLFYFDYLAFLAQFDYPTLAVIVFDHAVPAIAEYIPRGDFAEWFDAARLTGVNITMRGGNSWRGFALVPPGSPGLGDNAGHVAEVDRDAPPGRKPQR